MPRCLLCLGLVATTACSQPTAPPPQMAPAASTAAAAPDGGEGELTAQTGETHRTPAGMMPPPPVGALTAVSGEWLDHHIPAGEADSTGTPAQTAVTDAYRDRLLISSRFTDYRAAMAPGSAPEFFLVDSRQPWAPQLRFVLAYGSYEGGHELFPELWLIVAGGRVYFLRLEDEGQPTTALTGCLAEVYRGIEEMIGEEGDFLVPDLEFERREKDLRRVHCRDFLPQLLPGFFARAKGASVTKEAGALAVFLSRLRNFAKAARPLATADASAPASPGAQRRGEAITARGELELTSAWGQLAKVGYELSASPAGIDYRESILEQEHQEIE